MTTQSTITGKGRIAKIAIATVILLALVLAPAFGEVRSARARVIQRPNAPTTVRKANFQAGDILTTPLVSITVVNDPTPAFLKLGLELEFGGSWAGDYLKGSIIKRLGANESITFDNTKLLDNLGSVRWADVSNSSTLTEHTGVTGVSTIGNLKNLPEGTYTLYLTVSEVTLSNPNDIQSTITSETELIKKSDPNAKVEFKVVTIGGIAGISLPTVTNKSLSFQVPEIPIYSDSRSSTKIIINGPGITNYTATKSHAKSEGVGGLKGYPSDLTNGYVTYDLTALNFRAGQNYTIDIEFIDWNNLPITSKTTSVTFPAVRMSGTTDLADPYLPVFSWAFSGTDYANWVKEYRIYVNGAYTGYTADTTYQVRSQLTPGTAYTWYAMPINKDGSNFLDSPAAITRSFTTAAHTKMDVAITQPANGAVLFKDQAYTFTGTAAYYDGAVEKSGGAVWRFGSDTKTGLEVQYTPRTRATSGSPLQATLTVTDSLNLAKSSPTLSLTVLAPAIALQGETTRQVDKGASMTLAATPTDLAQVEWFVDGSSIGTGASRAYTFTEVGAHTVYAEGTSAADVDGQTRTVRSVTATFNVAGAAPVVAITQPTATVLATNSVMRQGSTLRVIAGITNENTLSRTTWTVEGPDTSQNGATGASIDFRPQTAGNYTLTVTAVDSAQKQGQASIRLWVTNPVVTMTSPTPNQVFSTTDTIPIRFTAPGSSSYFYYSNGIPIPPGVVRYSAPGTNSIAVAATYFLLNATGIPSETTIVSTPVQFIVRDITPLPISVRVPRDGDILRTGSSYTFDASVQGASQLIREQYWEVDGNRLAGNVYTPATGLSKQVAATYRVMSTSGVASSKTISIRVISPEAQVRWTGSDAYAVAAGQAIPIAEIVRDAENSWWLVNGSRWDSWDKTISEPGTYRAAVGWSVNAIDPASWSARTYTGGSNTLTFQVYSTEPPTITNPVPSATALREAVGGTVQFALTAGARNGLSGVEWQVFYEQGAASANGTGTTFSYQFPTAGTYRVLATATDTRGGTASREWTVKVIAPEIAIATPQAGMTFAQGSVPAPTVYSRDIDSYTFLLDGNAVPATYNWAGVPAGNHSVGAQGSYAVSSSATPRTVSATPVSFIVANRTPPNFTVEGIRDGDRLIAGRQYNFTTTRAGAETITWIRSNTPQTFNGPSYSYTPAAGDRDTIITARGMLNGISADKVFKVTVIDPWVNLILPNQTWFPAGQAIPLQAEKRAIDRIEWTVDSQAYSGTSVSFQPGQHTIAVKGFAAGVRLPSGAYGDWEYSGTGRLSASLRVAQAPRLTRLALSSQAIAAGGQVTATATVEGDATLIESIAFFLDATQVGSGAGNARTIPDIPAGPHLVRAVLTASGGTASAAEASLTAYEAQRIAIVKPGNNEVIAPDVNVEASMQLLSGPQGGIAWYLDGTLVPNSNLATKNLGRLAAGAHRIEVESTSPAGAAVRAAVNVTVPSDFALSLASPAADTDLLVGGTLSCLALVERVAGSDINVSDAAQYISWFVNGQDTGSKGLSYRFNPTTPGDRSIQARYQKGTMTRQSPIRQVRVRDIAAPSILLPLNGLSIRYATGTPIALKATGEPGAIFTWSIDGATIATGPDTSFIPYGISGEKQIKLVTTASGRSAERIVTVTMTPNNAPVLTFSAPATQYSGENLAFTASAFDPDEQNGTIPVLLSLDGAIVPAGTPRLLTEADIGTHSLAARAVDAQGAASTRQIEIKVEPGAMNINILSPMPGQAYLATQRMNLIAAVSAPGGATLPSGTLRWTVQYLDSPATAPETFTGLQANFLPRATGELAITASFTDAAGKARGTGSARIRVEAASVGLAIVWPHGSVVNAGARLTPTVSGLPADQTQALRWTLDGIAVPNIGALTAPAQSGPHTLVASYAANGQTARAELAFQVNQAPVIRITSPAPGTILATGTPVILSAAVEDDQPAGAIRWRGANGAALGEGATLVLADLPRGAAQATAAVTDPYGAEATASVAFSMYSPITASAPIVNEGQPVYLLAEGGTPLAARISIAGGLGPIAEWSIDQGANSVKKTGETVLFTPADLAAFGDGSVVVTVTVGEGQTAPAGMATTIRKDTPIMLTRNALAEKVSPTPDQVIYVGEPVAVELALGGFASPAFSVQVEGQAVTVPWTSADGGARYRSLLPATLFPREGVYQVSITVNGGGASRAVAFSLNVYQRRTGLFIDNVPSVVDLEQQPAPTVRVTNNTTERVTNYRWTNDLSPREVAYSAETTLQLNARVLQAPGVRTLTVQVYANGQPGIATASATLRVLGPMQLEIQPSGDSWTLRKGTDFTISARARDRDGAELPGGSIRWSSHLAGPLGSGERLPAAALQNLAAGEHVITVTATGATGTTISAVRTLRIIAAPTGGGGEGGGGDSGGSGGGGGGGGGGDFDDGQPIGGTSDGQGILGNNTLLQRFGIKR